MDAEEQVTHKLLIEFELQRETEYSSFLAQNDVIRGEPYSFTLFATNLGGMKFPGSAEGTVELKVRYRPYGTTENWSGPDEEPTFPEIAPDKKSEIYTMETYAIDEGTAWIELTMQAADGGPIEYYQNPTALIGNKRWADHFHVVAMENMRIIALLDRIARALG